MSEIKMPHSIEAEQQLLGALLLNNDLLDRVSGVITSASFYDPVHADIFDVITSRIESGKLADPITIKDAMISHDGLRQIGGPAYLARMAGASISAYAVKDYAQMIDDCAKRRQIVTIADDMRHKAIKDQGVSGQIEEAEARLYALAEGEQQQRGPVTFLASMTKAVENANAVRMRGGGLAGIATGLVDLDEKLGGLAKSDLLILAGRPSMGKTSLATNIAFSIARRYNVERGEGGVVGFFSLEMSHDQLTGRILSDAASISSHAIRNGDMSDDQMRHYIETARGLDALPIIIDDTPAISIAQLSARARRIKRTHGLDLLIVDYLQLMRGTSSSRGNRVQEIGEISMGLKAVAKELDIPVLALSQLSRAVESREDKRPQLSDLRESGSIEQDADVVMFVYRHEYYLEREKPDVNDKRMAEWLDQYEASRGVADVIIGKQRHGPIGTVKLSFDGEFTRFGNLAYSQSTEF